MIVFSFWRFLSRNSAKLCCNRATERPSSLTAMEKRSSTPPAVVFRPNIIKPTAFGTLPLETLPLGTLPLGTLSATALRQYARRHAAPMCSNLCLHGYLAHEKTSPRRALQQAYAYGPMVFLGGCVFSYEQGTPVLHR